jgi:hypothetical protein
MNPKLRIEVNLGLILMSWGIAFGCSPWAETSYARQQSSEASRGERERYVASPPAFACIHKDGRGVLIPLSSAVRDTIWIEGAPFSPLYHRADPPYPDSAEWFRRREPVILGSHTFAWYGMPVVAIPHEEIVPVGEYCGITVFAEDTEGPYYDAVFLPIGEGCEFQPYYPIGRRNEG